MLNFPSIMQVLKKCSPNVKHINVLQRERNMQFCYTFCYKLVRRTYIILKDISPSSSTYLFSVPFSIPFSSPVRLSMVGIPAGQNSPKWRSPAISEILHIEYRIVCCIETYLIHIYHRSKCSKCNWKRHIEGFCMWNVHFHINGSSPNIAYVILMSWPWMAIYILLLNYWLFSLQFSYHI